MKRVVLISLVLFLFSKYNLAQNVGINATGATPDVSAMLDIVSSNKGLLIPRIALTGVNDAASIASPQTSLLVFNTGLGGLTPSGYYYNSGTTGAPVWTQLIDAISGTSWLTSGNSGITTANFLGPTNSTNLYFKIAGSLSGNIDPGGNTYIGFQAGNSNNTSSNTGFGYKSLYSSTTGNNNSAFGVQTNYSNTVGAYNTSFGYYALNSNVAGSNATAIGTNAMLYANNSSTAFTDFNVAVGYEALRGSSTPASNTGNSNTSIGYQTLWSNTTGNNNAALGVHALYFNTTGYQNTAIGTSALYNNVAGNSGTAIGEGAMNYANNTATSFTNFNTAIGFEAYRGSATPASNTGNNNTAIGYETLWNTTSGSGNTANGVNALFANTTGFSNTGLGYAALITNTTGYRNTAIGDSADVSSSSLTDASAIGYNTKVTASFNMVFGDANVIGWGFGVAPGAGKAIKIGSGATNGNGAYLTTGGTWTNVSSKSIKDNITQLDGKDVLSKISHLEVARWRYIGTQEYHIGPFAEQFYELFNTGLDNKAISTVDPSGVALIGIQQLIKENQELKTKLTELELRLDKMNLLLQQKEDKKK